MSMSSIEVSLLASNYKMESDKERSSRRPHRPPPPPPPPTSQSKLSSPFIEQTVIPPDPEISPLSTETSTEPIEEVEKKVPTLLSEFKRLFDKFDYESVREEILNRQMTECDFTTVLWRIFLHCLPRDSNQWNEMLHTSRQNYEKLVHKYKIDPYKMSDDNEDVWHLNHPLSQDENSLWAQYFADEELKATITIDVRRTCPDILFFRNPRMIDLQLRILFAHSRHHQNSTPYRQGMHEILGVIVYSIHSESLKVNDYPESNELMKKLYDPQYLEHDAYAIYEKMMDHLRQFYALTTGNSVMRKCISMNDTKQKPFEKLNDVHIRKNDTVTRMNSIFERLRDYDRLLHCKLEELNIEPTVYGIRWLRLLFGREVPFKSIPNLWTVIFCNDEHFGFVDHFFIALLIEVGQIIGKQGEIEHNGCLELLMKQNVINNVEPVIRKALALTGRQLQTLPEEPIIPSIRRTDGTRLNPVENDRENTVRAKEVQRIPIAPAPQPRLNRPFIIDVQKSTSTPQKYLSDQPMNTIKHSFSSNTSFTSPPQISEPISSNASIGSELDLWSGKTMRQQYDDNVRLQKCCAQYMNKFVERLQTQICDLQAPNEDELHIQLSGLKQIANVLDGKLTFDTDSLQALLNYGCNEKSMENNNSDTG